jgi:AcrR family transcriptional regulator
MALTARSGIDWTTMTQALAGAAPHALHARKQDFVRNAIWDAAVDRFTANGFEATTVDEIARAAGVSTRTFFRYFASKNDLMGQGMVTYRTLLAEAIHGAPSALSPMEIVRHTVQRVAAEAASYPRTRQIVHIASTSAAAREAQLARRGEVETAVARAFAQKCRTKRGDDVRPRLLAGLTLLVLDLTFRSWSTRADADIVALTEHVLVDVRALVLDQPQPARKTTRRRRPALQS